MKITAIKQQLKHTDRYSVFVDDAYAFSLSESGLIESQLASGQELDAAELKRLKKAAGLDKAYYSALRYVAMRLRSEWEIQSYLARKEVDTVAATAVIDRLKKVGLLNDAEFARTWIANRRTLRNTSKRRLRLELMQKHIPNDLIDEALAEDETDERQTLRDLVQKKRARYPDKLKFMQYLARQGFKYDDIKSVLGDEQDE